MIYYPIQVEEGRVHVLPPQVLSSWPDISRSRSNFDRASHSISQRTLPDIQEHCQDYLSGLPCLARTESEINIEASGTLSDSDRKPRVE